MSCWHLSDFHMRNEQLRESARGIGWVAWMEKGTRHMAEELCTLEKASLRTAHRADTASNLSRFYPASVYTNCDQVSPSPLLWATGHRTGNTCSKNAPISCKLAGIDSMGSGPHLRRWSCRLDSHWLCSWSWLSSTSMANGIDPRA